jgi:hypothetical protein
MSDHFGSIAVSDADGLTPSQRALLAERLRGRGIAAGSGRFIPVQRGGEGQAPVSAEQQQILYHTYFVPGNPVYNEAVVIVKDGPLDLDALRVAFNQLVERHDIWHTTFRRVGRDLTQVVGPAPSYPLPLIDMSNLPAAERERRVADLVRMDATAAFDLKSGPLLRPILVRFDEHHHRLYLAIHHIIFDGVSLYRVILPEIIALYDAALGRSAPLAPPLVQYADYARWQRSGVLDEEMRRYLPYWRKRLADAPTLRLPLDKPRPTEQRFHGSTEWFVVPKGVVDQLRALGSPVGGTLFHVLVTAYALLLRRYTGDDDLVFATVADLRRRREFESMVGYCLTPLPVRIQVAARATFAELVATVRGELLDGLSNLVPFERMVDDLQPVHAPGANPVFQAMIVLEPPTTAPHAEWSLHQIDARIGRELGHAKTDFHFELDERPEGYLSGRFIFNTDLFHADFGPRVVADWLALLDDLVSTSRLPVAL